MNIPRSLRALWLRFVVAYLVGEDPHPLPSRMDRWDGQR